MSAPDLVLTFGGIGDFRRTLRRLGFTHVEDRTGWQRIAAWTPNLYGCACLTMRWEGDNLLTWEGVDRCAFTVSGKWVFRKAKGGAR